MKQRTSNLALSAATAPCEFSGNPNRLFLGRQQQTSKYSKAFLSDALI
jgi:hypothetical protein